MLDNARNLRIGQRSGAALTPGFSLATTTTLPEYGYLGQPVFCTDTGQLKVWDGTTWRGVQP